MLPELLPLAALLSSVPDWERDAAGVSALTLRALNAVAADYQQQGDAVSAAILLEAALRRCVQGRLLAAGMSLWLTTIRTAGLFACRPACHGLEHGGDTHLT